jgi:hypothetical protein
MCLMYVMHYLKMSGLREISDGSPLTEQNFERVCLLNNYTHFAKVGVMFIGNAKCNYVFLKIIAVTAQSISISYSEDIIDINVYNITLSLR